MKACVWIALVLTVINMAARFSWELYVSDFLVLVGMDKSDVAEFWIFWNGCFNSVPIIFLGIAVLMLIKKTQTAAQ